MWWGSAVGALVCGVITAVTSTCPRLKLWLKTNEPAPTTSSYKSAYMLRKASLPCLSSRKRRLQLPQSTSWNQVVVGVLDADTPSSEISLFPSYLIRYNDLRQLCLALFTHHSAAVSTRSTSLRTAPQQVQHEPPMSNHQQTQITSRRPFSPGGLYGAPSAVDRARAPASSRLRAQVHRNAPLCPAFSLRNKCQTQTARLPLWTRRLMKHRPIAAGAGTLQSHRLGSAAVQRLTATLIQRLRPPRRIRVLQALTLLQGPPINTKPPSFACLV